jgi:hypothetical protein
MELGLIFQALSEVLPGFVCAFLRGFKIKKKVLGPCFSQPHLVALALLQRK